VTWVKPKLVAEISFREITKDGAIRHPSFKGLREDKKPETVAREIPNETSQVATKSNEKTSGGILQKGISKPPKKERKTLLNPTEEAQTRTIGGHSLGFSNLSKIFWPKEKFTKET
jgi:bifunctional non-homologous end joining protein LigD